MSAIARYFLHIGVVVAGYDKTPSALTKELEKEGMDIHYEENVALIPAAKMLVLHLSSIHQPFLRNTKSWSISMRMDSPSRRERRYLAH